MCLLIGDLNELGFDVQLAMDEAMVESDLSDVALRFWMPSEPVVVLGRSSPASTEANLDACHRQGIQVLRRVSGGQAVVAGPGCLMYAVLIPYQRYPELRMLDRAHHFVMSQMQRAIGNLGVDVQLDGTSDLTLGGQKFSGNSLRCKKDAFVYHGTMICRDFDLPLVSQCLNRPIREPEYRQGRSHDQFLTRLPTDCQTLRAAITERWAADRPLPVARHKQLVSVATKLAAIKYATEKWTFKVP